MRGLWNEIVHLQKSIVIVIMFRPIRPKICGQADRAKGETNSTTDKKQGDDIPIALSKPDGRSIIELCHHQPLRLFFKVTRIFESLTKRRKHFLSSGGSFQVISSCCHLIRESATKLELDSTGYTSIATEHVSKLENMVFASTIVLAPITPA